MAVVRNLLVRAGADFSSMKREMVRAQAALTEFKVGVEKSMKLVGAALGGLAMGVILKDAVSDAIKVEAAMQQVGRTMGASSKAFLDWANNSATAFNMSRSEAIRYGAIYSNLISGFANGTAQTTQYTEQLLKASAVIAGATGRTMEDVMERIRSGMLGNTEAIEDLGVNVNIAMITSTDAFKRFANGRSWQQIDFQTQQQIRLFAILEQSHKKYGDVVADNTGSRLQQFVAQLKNVQLSLGQAFLPILNAVLPSLTVMAAALSRVMGVVAQFMQALFGKAKVQAQATDDQASSVSNLGDAYKKAGKAAKNATASFDNLNLIGNKSAGAADAAASAANAGVVIPDLVSTSSDAIPAGIQAAADKVREILKALNTDVRSSLTTIGKFFGTAFSGIGDTFKPLQMAVKPIKASLSVAGLAFKGLVTDYLVPAAKYILGTFIPSITIGFLSSFVPVFADTLVWAFQEFAVTLVNYSNTVVGLWNSTFLPALEKVRGAFLEAFPAIAGSMQALLNGSIKPLVDYFLNQFTIPLVEAIDKTLVPILADVAVAAIKEFATTFQWAAELLNDYTSTLILPTMDLIKKITMDTLQIITSLWTQYGATLLTNISGLLAGIRGLFQQLWEKMLKPIIVPMLDTINKLWDEHLKDLVAEVGDFVMKVVNGALEIINKFFIPILSWLVDKLSPGFVNSFNSMITTVSWAIGVIADVLTGVFKILGGVIDFVTGVFTGNWRKAWEGVREIFKGIFDTLYTIVKVPLNLIIDAINEVIKGLNSLSISFPDWMPSVGGKSFGVNITKIPHLAKGGLAYGPTLAMVGDNRGAASDPEVVAPLSKLAGMIGGSDNREVVSVLTSILQAIKSGQNISLSIGKGEVAKAAIEGIKDITRRTGQVPFTV